MNDIFRSATAMRANAVCHNNAQVENPFAVFSKAQAMRANAACHNNVQVENPFAEQAPAEQAAAVQQAEGK